MSEGRVHVNGVPESRRGRKLRAGDEVTIGGQRIRVQAARSGVVKDGARDAGPEA